MNKRRYKFSWSSWSCFVAVLLLVQTAQAAEWQIVIFGESPNYQSQAPEQAFDRVDRYIGDQLTANNHVVLDKAAINIDRQCSAAGCKAYQRQELIELVRSASKDVDLLVLYSLSFINREGAALSHRTISLRVDMVDIVTGRFVDGDDNSHSYTPPQKGCDEACLNTFHADQAGIVAKNLGGWLAEKLNAYTRKYQYELQFKGFTAKALQRFTAELRYSDDYESNALVNKGDRVDQQWLHKVTDRTYGYDSSLKDAAMTDYLERSLASIGQNASVSYSQSDSRFIIQHQGINYLWLYLLVALIAILLVFGFCLSSVYNRHNRQLVSYQRAGDFDQGQPYLKAIHIPWLKKWQAFNEQWQQQNQQWQQGLDTIAHQREAEAFTEALQSLKQLRKTAPNERSKQSLDQLEKELIAEQTASQHLAQASALAEAEPTQALAKIKAGLALNTRFNEPLLALQQQASKTKRVQIDTGVYKQAKLAADNNAVYQALSLIDANQSSNANLQSLRQQLLQNDALITGALAGDGGLAGWHILNTATLSIGRKPAPNAETIVLAYKRLSRGGKQCRIERQGQQFWLVEEGSSNGTWLDQAAMASGQREQLTVAAHTISLGGSLVPPMRGACQLAVEPCYNSPANRVVSLLNTNQQLLQDASIQQAWPSLSEDLRQQWLLLGEPVAMGISNNAIDVGCRDHSEPALWLSLAQGCYWLQASETAELLIDGYPQKGKVPVLANAHISINGIQFSLSEARTHLGDTAEKTELN